MAEPASKQTAKGEVNFNKLLQEAVFVVGQSKGGVGKTTSATQLIAPFLYDRLYANTENSSKKIRVYEVDPKNDSHQCLGLSLITESISIKNPESGLRDALINEMSNLERDYPIVIDIGVAFITEALNTIASVVNQDNLIYIVPVKQDESDANNAITTIEMIQSKYDKRNSLPPKILIVLSDSQWDLGDDNEHLKEYGIIFGNLFDAQTEMIPDSLFERCKIKESYVVLARDPVFISSKFSEQKTIYELAKMHEAIISGAKIFKTQNDIKEEYATAKLNGDTQKMDALQKESKRLLQRKTLVYECWNYFNKNLSPSFKAFEKVLSKDLLK